MQKQFINKSVKELILGMKQDKYLWGCRRIADELHKVHISVHYSHTDRGKNS